ncbi:alpha-L-arabinofuranosidase [Streptomyces sp. HC44]|uniref:Alpha-L-arabinofuranosidase n=1 Tax=Streptomyces scabichelini TaxID=2711217 RepID=A0A6G4V0C5_9ACTN|nr:AbfB domain-containing protein [Streptomyces scabichelini]NGO07431.1 alpha-L-arabinofuranosidase [Streptomyces scabichelini]
MPESKPGPAPEQPPKVWETGEGLDGGRVPGTRRLYLAGALALAVLAATVTAISILDRSGDDSSQGPQNTSAAEPIVPEVNPTVPTTEPSGKSGLSSPEPEPTDAASDASKGSGSPEAQQHGSEPRPEPSKPASSSKPPAKAPSTSRKSVQAVNYPDRYWHFSDGAGRLDRVSSRSSAETRRESTFTLVSGLADSDCVSFSTGDGGYLRHINFRLRADRDDGSALFEKDATFCPRPSSYSGAVMLEAVNYPGRFLRHRDFQLRLDPYEYSGLYQADSAFRLVDGLG